MEMDVISLVAEAIHMELSGEMGLSKSGESGFSDWVPAEWE